MSSMPRSKEINEKVVQVKEKKIEFTQEMNLKKYSIFFLENFQRIIFGFHYFNYIFS